MRRRVVAALVVGAVVAGLVAGSSPAARSQARASAPVEAAISWAEGYVGNATAYPPGTCLAFVHAAYLQANVNIGSAGTALAWWNAHASGQHQGDTNPPRGALVFWGASSAYGSIPANPAGHVGISLGGGNVISTESYPPTTSNKNAVHVFAIATRNASTRPVYPYLGWIAPPGVSLSIDATAALKTAATNKIVKLAGTITSYFYDGTQLHWIFRTARHMSV